MTVARAIDEAGYGGATPVGAALPIDPGGLGERDVLATIAGGARDAGVSDPRIFGHVVDARPAVTEAAHAAAALAALAAVRGGAELGAQGASLAGMAALGVLAASAAARCIGARGLARWLPRLATHSLVLRRPRRGRRVVVGALDRPRGTRNLRPAVLAGIGGALVAGAAGQGEWAATVALAAAAGWSMSVARVRPSEPSDPAREATVAACLVRYAAALDAADDTDTVVVLAVAGNADASGALAVCDWYGLTRRETTLLLVDPRPAAVVAARVRGWRARRVAAAALPMPAPTPESA